MSALFSLAGQGAIVTGAARGLGAAIATAFAAAGAQVLLSDADATCLAAHTAGLAAAGHQVGAFTADAGNADELAGLMAVAERWFGAPRIVVCNAGITGFMGPMEQAPAEDFARVLQVNLAGPLALCNLAAPRMAAAGGGSILLMSSLSGLRGNRAIGSYALAKAGLAQLARNLAVRWGPDNIRANAIAPGLIDTGLADAFRQDEAAFAYRMARTPLRRMGTPEEVAAAALFLAAPAGGFVTGHTLVVDGGTLIND